jgi:hypothetical protein
LYLKAEVLILRVYFKFLTVRHFYFFFFALFCLSANAQWEVVPSGTDSALYCVDWYSQELINIGGASGTFYRSVDLGDSLQLVSSNPSSIQMSHITHLEFVDELTGYGMSGFWPMKTINGGISWSAEHFATAFIEPAGESVVYNLKSWTDARIDSNLFLVNETNIEMYIDTTLMPYVINPEALYPGELAQVGTVSWMIRSIDGGQTIDLATPFYSQTYISSVESNNPKYLGVLDVFGNLFFSSDSGASFLELNAPVIDQDVIPTWLHGHSTPPLYFFEGSFGFYGGIGTDHSMYKLDLLSGNTFPVIFTDQHIWFDITMIGSQFVIAVGDSGMVATSFDQGDTWTVENIGTELDLYGVDFNGDDIIIVGDSGLILTNSAPLIDFIEISSEEDLFEIDSENGSLQLTASVFPESAPQVVSWSMVNLSGTATIDQNGLVTAQGNGLVMAVASISEPPGFTEETEAKSLSPSSGTFFILISGQGLGEQYIFGSDTTICGTDILTVSLPSSVAEVEWSDGSTELSFEISEAGTYWVTVTDGDFIRSDSIQVVQFPYPEFSLGEDLVACSGDDVSLEAPIFGTYEWSTGSGQSSISVIESGEYTLEITLNGCTSYGEINVSFLEVTEFDLGEDISLCEGESAVLSAPIEGEYSWSTGSTDSEIFVEEEGWVILEIFDGECSFEDSLFLEVKPLPEFSLGADTVICDTASIVLEAFVEGATYQWSDGSESASIEVDEEGEYTVLVTLNGCSSEDEISVGLINCTLSVLSEAEKNQFTIYPNPAQQITRVELPERLFGGTISLLNINGKLIQESIISSARMEFDLSEIESGIYIINAQKGSIGISKEVVKQ